MKSLWKLAFPGKQPETADWIPLIEQSIRYRHRVVELDTLGGRIEGRVTSANPEFLLVQETEDTQVLVPFRSVMSLRPRKIP